MNFRESIKVFQKVFLMLVFVFLMHSTFAQKADSIQKITYFKGNISITHNGFSLIPSFSLGKPATLFVLAAGGKRWSFEPELRFALEGKPWSFLFWWRYKIANTGKFSFNIGAHPALNFRTENRIENGILVSRIITRRFLAAELAPRYNFSRDIALSLYLLEAYGLDEGTRHTHFAALKAHFTNIKFGKKIYVQFNPQVFYLRTDDKDGFYATSILTLALRNFPLSISSIMNKAIQTDIVSKDFDWNVSLVYSFNKNFLRQ